METITIWGLYRDSGRENGNYYSLGLYGDNSGNYYKLGFYRDNGKENGNYYNLRAL